MASRAEGDGCDFASRAALLISPGLHCLGRVCRLVGNVGVRKEAGGVDHSHRTVLCLDLGSVRTGGSGDGRQGKCGGVERRRRWSRRRGRERVTWSHGMLRILVCSASGHEGRMHSEPPQIGLHFPSKKRFRAICSFTLPAFQSLLLSLAQRRAGGKIARVKLSMVARPHGISTSSSSSRLLGIDEGAPASQAITTKRRRKALLISSPAPAAGFGSLAIWVRLRY